MSKFRLTNNVPDVYVNQSRDFQLLLRLYDSIFSGTKLDIDSMQGLINTSKTRNSILPLLSTKVGFFTNLEINDDKLRILLGGFPSLIRNKGSLLAIKEALNLYLKTEHIKCNIIISYSNVETTMGNERVLDHTLSIGSDKTLKNPQILQEIFKYILPIGFRYRFYSFRSLETEVTELENNEDIIILSKIVNNPYAQIRGDKVDYSQENLVDGIHVPSIGTNPDYTDPADPDNIKVIAAQDELLGAVGIMEVASREDSKFPLDYCLRFSSDNGFLSFKFGSLSTQPGWDGILEYSYDRLNWIPLQFNQYILNNAGSDIFLRGSNNTVLCSNIIFNQSTGNVEVDGNIESLLDWRTVANNQHPIMGNNCFQSLFAECSKLVKAPRLPATTLAERCYHDMFSDCYNLKEAPELPATTLAISCYEHMFWRCTGLEVVPALPATTFAESCYGAMFSGCTNLVTLPRLRASSIPIWAYTCMFQQCSKIRLSQTQSEEYPNAYRIPAVGTSTSSGQSVDSMFIDTGGSFTGSPSLNRTYYTSNEII